MNLSSNVNLFLGLQTQLKVYHWQTKGFSRHEAFDKTLSSITDLVDSYVEEAMGKYGRFVLNDETKTISLSNLSELEPKSMIKTVCDALTQFTDELDPKDTNLLNIRDEILGKLNKLLYLLTLE